MLIALRLLVIARRAGPGLEELTAGFQVYPQKLVNVRVGVDFTTGAQLAGLGVRRISVGGALARAAWTGFLVAAQEIADAGTFTALAGAIPFAEIDPAFRSSRV